MEVETGVSAEREKWAAGLWKRGRSVEVVSYLLFAGSAVGLAVAVVIAVQGEPAGGALSFGAAAFGLGCWTNLIGQLIHVRAELARG